MKFLLIYICCFFIAVSTLASEKKSFSIEGKLGNASAPATVFLFYNDPVTNELVRDSAFLDEGKFVFRGTIEYPTYARIAYTFNGDLYYATGSDERRFYLDKGEITINGRQLFNAEIKGSPTQDLLVQYLELVRPIQKKMTMLMNDKDDIYKPYSPKHRLSLDSLYNELGKEYNQLSMDFIEAHPNNFLSVDMLSSEIATHPENNRVETLFNQLDQNLRESVPGKRLEQLIKNTKLLGTGHIAPDFTAETLQGEQQSLSMHQGKWLLLVFWSPTCDICHHEAKDLKQIYAEYKKKGLEIMAFTIDNESNKYEWEKTVKNLDLPYITVSDFKAWKSPVVQQYKINSVPENYLINPDGLIYAVNLTGYDLTNRLQDIFDEVN